MVFVDDIHVGMDVEVSPNDEPALIRDLYKQTVMAMEEKFQEYFCISTDHVKALKGTKKWVMLNEIYVSHATMPSWFKVIAKAAIGRLSFIESPEEPPSKIVSLGLELKRAGLPAHVATVFTAGLFLAYDIKLPPRVSGGVTGVTLAMRESSQCRSSMG